MSRDSEIDPAEIADRTGVLKADVCAVLDELNEADDADRVPDEARDEPEAYHPARNVSGEAVGRALSTLDGEAMEAMNQDSDDPGIDDAERVLVEVNQQNAEYVRRHAWTRDRDPGDILDEMIRFAQIHHEDALDEDRK